MRATLVTLTLMFLAGQMAFALPDPYAVRITPKAEAYSIPPNLAGVKHLDKAANLTLEQLRALATRGFVVTPDTAEQMFFLYEEYGEDAEQGPVPNFITVDSVLQAYHVLFDFALREVETTHLIKVATSLTDLCAGLSVAQVKSAQTELVRTAAARNLAYFLVARKLLTGRNPSISEPLPERDQILQMANQDLARIAEHGGRFPSAIMERTVQFDQFVPRGHYTRSEALRKYFMGLMWYGTIGFELDEGDAPQVARRHLMQALLIVKLLAGNEWGRTLWDKLYEPTKFFVGGADDLTWYQYLAIAREVYGHQLPMDKLANPALLEEFMARARKRLPAPRIAPALLQADQTGKLEELWAKPQGRQFRFLGQRFIPDSYILQQLVFPLVMLNAEQEPRHWPMGLDVMAVLGSARARDLLIGTYRQDQYANYVSQLTKLTDEFASLPEREWWENLYWGWLHSLRPLLAPCGEGYPTFMRSEAWLDKELVTALGSWAQLRHDTVLYGKPSGAEMGGGEEKRVQGYVEPYPEVYGRLCYLARLTRDGLRARGILPPRLDQKLGQFGELLLFLKDCAEKHLTNVPLSERAYQRIQWFGGELERLTLSVIEGGDQVSHWRELVNETDRHMATIADIHTSFTECLEVGVGCANRLYVVVPHPAGGLQIAKGGVMSYYEFRWPVSDRLTDEKWVRMLKEGKQPPMPDWTRSFLVP